MRRTKTRPFAPSLEALEGRDCPAGISLINGVLDITGTAAADTVTVIQDDANNRIIVDDTVQTVIYFSHRVSVVNVGLDAGDDHFTYRLASDYTRLKHVNVALGDDHDEATLDFGMNNSHALRANLYLTVAGMAGDDVISSHFGDFLSTSSSPRLHVSVDLGNGNDSSNTNLWGRLAGAGIARFNLQGNSGDDNMSFAGTGGVDPSALLDVRMDGGWGNDKATMDYAGEMDGALQCRVDGGIRGNDVVFADLFLNGGSSGKLDAVVSGGDGADEVGLRVNDGSGGGLTIAQALLDGGAGLDTLLAATANVQVMNVP